MVGTYCGNPWDGTSQCQRQSHGIFILSPLSTDQNSTHGKETYDYGLQQVLVL